MEDISERPSVPEATPLYYCAACDLRSLTEYLAVIHPNDVNTRDGYIWAPLYAAVEKGHLDVARVLLEHGAYVNFTSYSSWTPLHHASSRRGSDAMLLLLLEHGADVDSIDNHGQTPLHLACEIGRLNAVQLLVVFGADVNKRTIRAVNDSTPLHQAVLSGNVEVVRLLLELGANVNGWDDGGRTALHFASDRFGGNFEITLALLKCGADVNARDKLNMAPLDLALNNGYHDIVQLLLSMV